MALIRINLPGKPVELIDLGYARGRVSVAHGGPMGGPLEGGETPWTRNARLRREERERALSTDPHKTWTDPVDKVLTGVTKNPDNGAVEAPITEVHS